MDEHGHCVQDTLNMCMYSDKTLHTLAGVHVTLGRGVYWDKTLHTLAGIHGTQVYMAWKTAVTCEVLSWYTCLCTFIVNCHDESNTVKGLCVVE